jgi:hypothetical protein
VSSLCNLKTNLLYTTNFTLSKKQKREDKFGTVSLGSVITTDNGGSVSVRDKYGTVSLGSVITTDNGGSVSVRDKYGTVSLGSVITTDNGGSVSVITRVPEMLNVGVITNSNVSVKSGTESLGCLNTSGNGSSMSVDSAVSGKLGVDITPGNVPDISLGIVTTYVGLVESVSGGSCNTGFDPMVVPRGMRSGSLGGRDTPSSESDIPRNRRRRCAGHSGESSLVIRDDSAKPSIRGPRGGSSRMDG